MKKFLGLFMIVTLILGMVTGCAKVEAPEASAELVEAEEAAQVKEGTQITFTDDSDKEIVLKKPAETVISLYSVHTENLYALGAGDAVVGVGMSDKYPEEVLTKTQYSYKDDPELIIAANPDVVLIRSMIANRYPDYVKALEGAGIVVVDLYCSEYDNFDQYMNRLGLIVGQEEEAAQLVATFHETIKEVKARSALIENKKTAYFESIGSKFKTATPTSFVGMGLEFIGVQNIASDVEYDGTSTVVTYGEEALLAKGPSIDVFIAQKGAMNKTVSVEGIKERPGFTTIKAVKEDNVIIIDEKLISGATMRYIDGLKLLQDRIYGAE